MAHKLPNQNTCADTQTICCLQTARFPQKRGARGMAGLRCHRLRHLHNVPVFYAMGDDSVTGVQSPSPSAKQCQSCMLSPALQWDSTFLVDAHEWGVQPGDAAQNDDVVLTMDSTLHPLPPSRQIVHPQPLTATDSKVRQCTETGTGQILLCVVWIQCGETHLI